MTVDISRLGRPFLSCRAGFRVPENVPEYMPLPWFFIDSITAPDPPPLVEDELVLADEEEDEEDALRCPPLD